jgi:hypothetical protein
LLLSRGQKEPLSGGVVGLDIWILGLDGVMARKTRVYYPSGLYHPNPDIEKIDIINHEDLERFF